MLILLVQGEHHHLLINTYPLFFVKCGILGIIACYLIAIIKKWYYQAKELSVQKLEAALMTEKLHNQLISERSRIAADMHDDVGAGLSRIRYIISAITNDKSISETDINKIMDLSDESVEKMNEIIWSLNQGNRNLDEIIYHIRSQCATLVSNANLNFICELPDNIPTVILGWNEGRNMYMLAKEAVNNAVKHAEASTITLDFSFNSPFVITITDNGKGFDPELPGKDGNGLKNYEKRTATLNGSFSIETSVGKGTKVIFRFML
jgi:signal transduction histidine kinase